MEKKITAVEWLIAELERRLVIIETEPDGNVRETMINNFLIDADQAKAMERQQMIDFALWLKENDTPENAEMFFGFSDDDMLNYFLNIQQ